jgi:hypothetical protein
MFASLSAYLLTRHLKLPCFVSLTNNTYFKFQDGKQRYSLFIPKACTLIGTPAHLQSHTRTLAVTHPRTCSHTPAHLQSYTRALAVTHLRTCSHTPAHLQSHTRALAVTHPRTCSHTPAHLQSHTRAHTATRRRMQVTCLGSTR